MKTLLNFLPPKTDNIISLIKERSIFINITKPRKTKLGDFRVYFQKKKWLITINNNLNPYTFLIVLIHEIAHWISREDYGSKIRPHGKEWKYVFKQLMNPYLTLEVFPEEILIPFSKYMRNPTATCFNETNRKLVENLKKYD